jgi:hypothetical protein
MKRFSQLKLIKELKLWFTFGVIILLYSALPDYYHSLNVQAQVQQQQPPSPIIGIKITSPIKGQQVPVGELTISGISTDNATTDCTVYADINNLKPFQKAVATGPDGVNDYSTWTFTYTDRYHLITNGTNNLTSKLSCVNDSTGGTTANLTKSYSVDVIGVVATMTNNTAATTSTSEEIPQQESPTIIDSNITSIMENITAATTASPESIPTPPTTTSSVPLSPSIPEQEEEAQPEPGTQDDDDTTIYWDIQ